MKTYTDETGRKLTLKRASAEWFNNDCPSIWRDSDGVKIWHGWSMHSGVEVDECDSDYEKMQVFRVRSKRAFLKKYPHCEHIV